LHFYVWWLLFALSAEPTRVSPDRRWKLWTAVLLNIPVWCCVAFALGSLGALFPASTPPDPFAEAHWRDEGFVPFGAEAWVRFPNAIGSNSGDTITADGEKILYRLYYTRVKDTQFALLLKQYPARFAKHPVDQLYEGEIRDLVDQFAPADVIEERKATMAGKAAREVLIKGRFMNRSRLLIVDDRLYVISVISSQPEDMRSDLAVKYFASFSLR
jgi:hypothetical protein